MEYCPHCMMPNASGRFCTRCGGDLSWTGQKGMDLPVGTALTGGNGLRRYWIGAARGKGGFGITYAAIETGSQRKVAIKEYYPVQYAIRSGNGVTVQAKTGQEQLYQRGMNRFLSEAKTLLSMEDLPTVVRILDYFPANGTAYLVMEFLDGLPLHAHMRQQNGPIPAQELLQKLEPVIRDLGILHQRHVLHRDISPDNMMWMPDGTIKLMDFGSARSMEAGRNMTALMKEGFSPVEQYRSTGQGPWTDIYALSATIYYCITGAVPPGAVGRLTADTLKPPTELGAQITAEQESALLWGLSIQPTARPQSVEQFYQALYRTAPQQQQPPQPQPPVYPPQQPPYTPPQQPPQQQVYTSPLPGPQQMPLTTPLPGPQQQQQTNTIPVSPPPIPAEQQQTEKPRSKSKSKLLIPIAAAVIVLIIAAAALAIFLVNRGSGNHETVESSSPADTETPASSGAPTGAPTGDPSAAPTADPSSAPDESASPSAEPSPEATPEASAEPSTEPTPEPTPDGAVLTENGFAYEVHGDYAVLTGYAGGGDANMPSEVEDGIPVTEIADEAFAGETFGGVLQLPIYLEHVGSGAFRDTSGVQYLVAYSSFAMQPDSFAGSDLKDVILYENAVDIVWSAEGDVRLFPEGMDSPAGRMVSFTKDSNCTALYGITDQNKGVLLDLFDISGTYTPFDTLTGDNDEEYPLEWVDDNALNRIGAGVTIVIPENCLFNYGTYLKADWDAGENTLADMWLLTCSISERINTARGGAEPIEADPSVLQAAWVRAQECATLADWTRPNGENGFSAIEEQGGTYQYGLQCRDTIDPWSAEFVDFIVESAAPAIDDADAGQFAGQYYTNIGVAYYITTDVDGNTVYSDYAFAIIP